MVTFTDDWEFEPADKNRFKAINEAVKQYVGSKSAKKALTVDAALGQFWVVFQRCV